VEKDGGGGGREKKTGKNTAAGRKGGEGAESRTMITKGKATVQLINCNLVAVATWLQLPKTKGGREESKQRVNHDVFTK